MAVSTWKFSLLILLSLLQGYYCGSVNITPKEQLAKIGDNVTVMCKVSKKLQYCRFQFNGEAVYNLGPNKGGKSITYAGAGFDNGECGATLLHAEEKHNGLVVCYIGTDEDASELSATMKLVIARTPTSPELQLSQSNKTYYKEGEVLQATCTVKNGRPAANLTWYLNDTVIYEGLSEVYSVKEDLHTIMQNISHLVAASDDGKQLKCVADHPGLMSYNNYDATKINVQYKPKTLHEPIEHFDLVEGAEGRIAVVVNANPKPKFIWSIGGKTLYEDEKDGRFSVLSAENKNNGSWESILLIDSLTKEDVKQDYKLTAENELGVTTYEVVISTSPRPKVLEIGIGTIFLIVLALLLISIIIGATWFARSTGRWCFVGGDAEKEVSHPEGTENPAVTHHASTEYINNSPELKKEKPKEDTPV